MTDTGKHKKSSWLYTLSKISFFFIAFVLVVITVLGNMGGKSDFHRESLEQFASENVGLYARIGNLISMTYFPSISFDFEDMKFYASPEEDVALASIDKAQASFGFWDVLTKSGKVKIMNVQGVNITSGTLFSKPSHIKYFSIMDDGTSKAALKAQGTVGSVPVNLSVDMEASGEGSQRKFRFLPRRDVKFDMGDMAITSTMINAVNPYLSFQDINIFLSGNKNFSGSLDVSKRREHEMVITGSIKAEESGSLLIPDLIYDSKTRVMTGTISSDNFIPADFASGGTFNTLVRRLVEYLGSPETNGKVLDDFALRHDITLDLKGAAPFKGKLAFKNNILVLK